MRFYVPNMYLKLPLNTPWWVLVLNLVEDVEVEVLEDVEELVLLLTLLVL